MNLDYIIFSLPRSRSYWLSRFLSYGGMRCEHDDWEGLNHRPWFNGTVETGLIHLWPEIKLIYPKTKMVIVRRPHQEILSSFKKLDIPVSDEIILQGLEFVAKRMDELQSLYPDTLSTTFSELSTEAGCKQVFEYCLGKSHDHAWWKYMDSQNLQIPREQIIQAFESNGYHD